MLVFCHFSVKCAGEVFAKNQDFMNIWLCTQKKQSFVLIVPRNFTLKNQWENIFETSIQICKQHLKIKMMFYINIWNYKLALRHISVKCAEKFFVKNQDFMNTCICIQKKQSFVLIVPRNFTLTNLWENIKDKSTQILKLPMMLNQNN